jgi:hypothetical protein
MTVTIADDVRAEIERMRAEQGIGPSEALNTLARRGMRRSSASPITLPAPVAMGGSLRPHQHRRGSGDSRFAGARVVIVDANVLLHATDEETSRRFRPVS